MKYMRLYWACSAFCSLCSFSDFAHVPYIQYNMCIVFLCVCIVIIVVAVPVSLRSSRRQGINKIWVCVVELFLLLRVNPN